MPRKTILWIVLAAAAWTPALIGAARGGVPTQYDFTIAEQPLGSALQEFAKQSGVQIIFFSQTAEGLRAPALKGRYTLAGALQVLLGRSQLTFQVINPKTVEIRVPPADDVLARSDPRSAKDRRANARADRRSDHDGGSAADNANSLDEVVVNGTAEGLVATRTETPLREIPQTISIISAEQMRQQNDTDLADVLNNAAGITVVQRNSLDSGFISRGFTVTTFHIDGGAALNSFSNTPIFGTPDLGEYDHVEVLRGSDALFGGIGNPGATVNMIRKRPLASNEVMFSTSAGSWNNFRAEADVTGPLGFDGALRGRMDAVLGDRDYFFKPASLERKKVFAVLEYDLTVRTLLTVGGSYQWNDAVPFINGWPSYFDGSDAGLSRSTALAFDWSRYDTRTREIYAQLQHAFGGGWKLKLNATSLDTAAEYGYGAFDSPINAMTKALPVLPFAFFSAGPNTQDQFAFDGTLTGSLELFGRRVAVAVGGDYTHFSGNIGVEVVNSFGPAVSDVFAFDPAAYPTAPIPTPPMDRSQAATNQSGEFASAKVYLTDALAVVGGARISANRASNTVSLSVGGLSASITQAVKDADKVTPFLGVTYDLSPHYSVYASYADIYQSNDGQRKIGGTFLSPADGIDRELGIKGSWRNGALNGLLVLYDVDQRGLAVLDQNASFADLQAFPLCCFLPNGVNSSKGVDAELNGALTSGWLIGTGYTFNINHDFAGGDLSSATPRHLLKLWSSTELPGEWRRWTMGGGVQAQSGNFASGYVCPEPNSQGDCVVPEQVVRNVQRPFAIVNLRVGYQINTHWRGALSINNVLDHSYYQTIGTPAGGSWYGEPREYALRIDGKY